MELLLKQWALVFAISTNFCWQGRVQGAPVIVEDDILVDQTVVKTMSAYELKTTNTWSAGLVPFNIDTNLRLNRGTLTNIKTAMYNIQGKTNNCIRFFPRTSRDVDYINITDTNSGCFSSVGRIGGEQIVNIGLGCDTVGILMHELLHALGFWHEQSRTDRDNYVVIKYENIIPGSSLEFDTRPDTTGVQNAIGYDFHSILHYKYNQFAKLKTLDTIVPNSKYSYIAKTELGQREYLSEKDIQKIMWLYKCPTVTVAPFCAPPDFEYIVASPDQLRYSVGAKVSFTCKTGSLIGPVYSECMATGFWSGGIPFCVQGDPRSFIFCDMGECLTTPVRWYMPRIYMQVAKWQQQQGPCPTAGTGPSGDHTYNNSQGYYLMMEASGVPAGQSALILSPHIPVMPSSTGISSICIMFYFFMYGDDLDSTTELFVYIGGNRIWSWDGTKKNTWIKMMREVQIQDSYAYAFIVARRGAGGDRADVVIDDVFLGPCYEVQRYNNAINDADITDKPIEYL